VLTRRDVLLDVMRKSGHVPLGLEGPEIPSDVAHVWRWFLELDEARGVSMGGVAPISYTDIRSWAELTGRDPSPLEVRLIRRLDRARLRAI